MTTKQDALADLTAVCDEIFERWDKDMRSGKLLTALSGMLPGYRPECDRIRAALAAPPTPPGGGEPTFQDRVDPWLIACFGEAISRDRAERNHRFLEEALELVQSGGCTAHEAHQLVDYVYGREVGDMAQEVGGVMVTLAALCLAHLLDMHQAAEIELARVWTKVEQIRAKQAAKPKHSPFPEATAPPSTGEAERALAIDEIKRGIEEARDDLRSIAAARREEGPVATKAQASAWKLTSVLERIAALRAPAGARPVGERS